MSITEALDASGTATARYSQGLGIDEPLARTAAGATYFYQADGLGSITSLSSSTGTLPQTYKYDSFGNLTSSTGSVTNPFQFTARENDAETGLYYYRARYYDPSVGRFLNEDPLRFDIDFNFYRYVRGNATNYTDPSGLAWVFCQHSGELYYDDGDKWWDVGSGYSGHGKGVNSPGMQAVRNVGPIPEGEYNIGPQRDTVIVNSKGKRVTLKGAMRLAPMSGADTLGRGGFLIHGDNGGNNQSASTGCVVLDRGLRDRIAGSGDNELRVLPCY